VVDREKAFPVFSIDPSIATLYYETGFIKIILLGCMASINDVARLAGVSKATVSRVLNKTAPVHKQTEKRVNKAIRLLQYNPNLLAKGLKQKSGRLIGLLVPDINHPTYSLIVKHVESYARAAGFHLVLANTGNNPAEEARLIDNLLCRNVDGIIFLRVSNKSIAAERMAQSGVPFVLIDRAYEHSPFPFVMSDNYMAGVLAARFLISKGHHKIACVTGPSDISASIQRLAGFQDTLKQYDITLAPDHVLEGDFSFECGRRIARDILDTLPEISAIWAQNDPMAIGMMHAFLKNRIRIPGDISIMGMDDIELAALFVPGLTTVRQPFEKMCELAVQNLISSDSERFSQLLLMPELVKRDSVGTY